MVLSLEKAALNQMLARVKVSLAQFRAIRAVRQFTDIEGAEYRRLLKRRCELERELDKG